MSDDEDLFADSDDGDDTDDLIAASKPEQKVAKAKPKRLQKKKLGASKQKKHNIPDADNDDDSDGPGLFDSDSEDEAQKKKSMSKREKMEALQAKKRQTSAAPATAAGTSSEAKPKDYDSGDSYASDQYERTKEDIDFIDTEGDDADAINELYAEQKFYDERPDGEDEDGGPKKKKRKIRYDDDRPRKERDDDLGGEEGNGEPENPIMAAVHRMKKKKRVAKKLSELEDEAKIFLSAMEQAADQDEVAIAERRPATKKLSILQDVVDMLARQDMTRMLLDLDLLAVCKRWIQPLPSGALGNVTIRQKLISSIAKMTGDSGITPHDLKRSEFGKVVMTLYMHRSETPAMKRQLKALIEQWSRPIFSKSGNMKDLERVHASRSQAGLSAISRSQNQQKQPRQPSTKSDKERDLQDIIKTGSKKAESGMTRVRVPFSKGFQYTVRPMGRSVAEAGDERPKGATEVRGNLSKRMLEKSRAVAKNQRSANISVEGRPTKN